MKINVKQLNTALRILGKVVASTSPVEIFRQIRFVGQDSVLAAMATDGNEIVSVSLDGDVTDQIDFCVSYRELREMLRVAKGEDIEITGTVLEYPEIETIPENAVCTPLPADFSAAMAELAKVINLHESRVTLRGINVSTAGLTATNGKELLNIPSHMIIKDPVTLPFPFALLAAKATIEGFMWTWDDGDSRKFRIVIGNFLWQGKVLPGIFPDWQRVIPSDKMLDYSITFHDPEAVLGFLKLLPDDKNLNAVELSLDKDIIRLCSRSIAEMELICRGESSGTSTFVQLRIEKSVLRTMLQLGHCTVRGNSKNFSPILAEGGHGIFVAMPLRNTENNQAIQPQKEERKMERNIQSVEPVDQVSVVSPIDELSSNVEELRTKLKCLLDESSGLIRKVKEVALQQKQKEREFVQARRAIERIRMTI